MVATVQTAEKLERKISLSLPASTLNTAVQEKLKKLSRQARVDGFRPGKVPPQVLAKLYGDSVRNEIINEQIGQAFVKAVQEIKLHVAGMPHIHETASTSAETLDFEAHFEVYPEVSTPDLSELSIEKTTASLDPAAIDKTLLILRKQRRNFVVCSTEEPVGGEQDKVTLDFEGKLEGESFPGGSAQDYSFVLGEGQMLAEFEAAVVGMKIGDSKTFPLNFPADYHNKDLAGKTTDFLVTLKKLEKAMLPELDDALAKSFKATGGTVEGLRIDIQKSLERELEKRLSERNKAAVWEALLSRVDFEVPKALVKIEMENSVQGARNYLQQSGKKGIDKLPIDEELFRPQATRRVRLGLLLEHLLEEEKGLRATPEAVETYIQDLCAHYEDPEGMQRWYHSDKKRLAQLESQVTERNVVDFIFSKATVKEKTVPFNEIMEGSA